MNTAIAILGQDKIRADVFFDRTPVVTDWDAIRKEVLEGVITVPGSLGLCQDFEVLAVVDRRDHEHWITQQKLRLAMLHEKGKPLELAKYCDTCGLHKADPLHDDECLHCREERKQRHDGGSRGSCEFLKPCFNPKSRSWGLIYYWSHQRDDAFMFFLVDFFKTRRDAEQAVLPMRFYEDWLDMKYSGMYSTYRLWARLFPLEDCMQMKLPLNPEQFREQMRTGIEKDMEREHSVLRWAVDEAMRHHKGNEDE